MDLSRKTALTEAEMREVAELLHYGVLTELFDATQWRGDQAVFHGGTSLRVVRKSDRYSEDLDFLIAPDEAARLQKAMAEVREGLLTRLALRLPGSQITIKENRGKDGGSVLGYTVRWEHPMRMGAVRVKAEFYRVPGALQSAYSAEDILPTQIPDIAVSFKTPIPAPRLIFAWADKIKAIATRDHMKYRDVYDIWFLLQQIKPAPEREEAIETIGKVASLYEHDLNSVGGGLTRVLESGCLEDAGAFTADMKRWLEPKLFSGLERTGFFAVMLEAVRGEIERVRDLIGDTPCLKI